MHAIWGNSQAPGLTLTCLSHPLTLPASFFPSLTADFGLARLLHVEDPYTAKEGSKFPIKVRVASGGGVREAE